MIRKINYNISAELPYDPEDVNIRLQHFRTSDLVEMIRGNRIFEDTWLDIWGGDDLQRNKNLWNNNQKSLFIESLMIKLPIPLFYFDGGQKPWRVVDGLQRLHTIMSFIDSGNKSNFKLTGLEYLVQECEDRYFDELPGYLRSRILDASLEAYVINPGTPAEVKYNIFKRINTGGLKLRGQEIRNAFCRGVPAEFTKSLANEEAFLKLTNKQVSVRRMDDREYVTRFIAFQIFNYTDYYSKMDLFLTEAMMELYNREEFELNELKDTFLLSCSRVFRVLGEKALFRIKKDRTIHNKPNKALFDTLIWNFSLLNEKEYKKISSNCYIFKNEYTNFIISNDSFIQSIADTTGSKKSVITRFELVNNFVKNYVQ